MTQRKRSLIAGILYLSLIIPGPFAFLLIPDMIYNAVDPNQYILNNMYLIYIWLFLDVLIIGIEIALAFLLLKLFLPVDRFLSQVAYVLRMIVVGVMIINVVYLMLILIGSGTNPIGFVDLHVDFTFVWQFVFSFHVLVLGIIMIKYVKTLWKYLGYILILGSVGYLIDVFNHFILDSLFFTSVGNLLLIFVTLAEIGMGIALLLNKATPKTINTSI
ncbi:hypothetical protein BK011_02650 [Tenericutes bacterium MZ-XQ]|nr:hypothetical protein BK011_02650 [Tenericutes bacterium MZ-XQ]